jgi:hypothetical protein
MNKENVAKDYLERHSDVNEVYVTDDLQVFTNISYARTNRNTCGGEVTMFDRSIVQCAAPKTDKVETGTGQGDGQTIYGYDRMNYAELKGLVKEKGLTPDNWKQATLLEILIKNS